MNKNIEYYFEDEDLEKPTTEECLIQVEKELNIVFPDQYKEFMLISNGAEGCIGQNSYLAIWSIEEIVELNKNYCVEKNIPGFVFFGSDGGGMAFAFDYREAKIPIVTIPFESIHFKDAKRCGDTFNDFLQILYEAD